ncbi:MAG: SBBP repeat-containing protein, partial [Chloroflexota bacterium]|nr:SBBP repeat-containing protein [Chloroflexota bacterium]
MLVVSPLLLGMACLLDRDEEDEKVSLAWVSRYDGEGLSWEYATAIAVDQSGNVYVTGYSGSEMTDWDYCTVKYNKDGQQLWQRKYGGVDGKDDCAHDIEVDSLGNVYVTGYSQCE